MVGGGLILLGVAGLGRGRTVPGERTLEVRGPHQTKRVSLAGQPSREIEVRGPLGTTKVRVGGGSARIVSSPCPERICEKMGAISTPGDWVACIPNGVVLRIEATRELDGVTR